MNTRLPCPSPTPGVHSKSCPSSQWCHPAISSPSPPAPHPSQHQGLFQWVNSLHEVAKVLEFQERPISTMVSIGWILTKKKKSSLIPGLATAKSWGIYFQVFLYLYIYTQNYIHPHTHTHIWRVIYLNITSYIWSNLRSDCFLPCISLTIYLENIFPC